MRPTRKSIFDNLTPEQAVLWDCFNAESGGTAKLTARRARRRPLEGGSRMAATELYPEPWSEAHGAGPRNAQSANAIRWYGAMNEETAAFWSQPHWAGYWVSPAQRGKERARKERNMARTGMQSVWLQTAHGPIQIVPHAMCPSDTIYLVGGSRVHTAVARRDIPPIRQIEEAAQRLADMGAPLADEVRLSIQNMRAVLREIGHQRRYDASR